jgi:hypothetical protein
MPEDRSLDEFAVDAADPDESAGTTDADAVDGKERADGDAVDREETTDGDAVDVDPAVSMSTWTTDGAACDRCGDRVARRWLDDGALVCGDCKEW